MAERSRAEDLRQQLIVRLAARLEPDGWRRVDAGTDRLRLAVFGKEPNADFMVTAETFAARSWPDRLPVVVTDVMAGVSYEPLRRLYPLLGEFQYAVLHSGFGSDGDDELDENDENDDEDDDESSWEPDRFELRSEADVSSVAEQLVALVKEHADAFGDEIASVDALLDRLGDPVSEYLGVERAAVLAAAGRYDEASRALDRLKPDPDVFSRPSKRRTARQLRRWIESGGNPA